MDLIKKMKAILVAALVGVLLLGIGGAVGFYKGSSLSKEEELQKQIDAQNNLLQSYEIDNTSLMDALDSTNLSVEKQALLIASLEQRKERVKYIERIVTIIEPTDPLTVYAVSEIPDSYLHKIGKELVVASFSNDGQEISFETSELTFATTVVMSDTKATGLLDITSSYDPNYTESFPVVVNVSNVSTDRPKVFRVDPGLGISLSYPDVGVSIYASTLHYRRFDFLAPRVTLTQSRVGAGVDVASFNIGDPLPLLQDTWLSLGATYFSDLTVSPTLTLGSKL